MCRIGMIAIYPNTACLYGPWHLVHFMGISCPHTGAQSVQRIIGNADGFVHCFESSNRRNRPKNFFLEDAHFIMTLKNSRLYIITMFQPAVLMKGFATC